MNKKFKIMFIIILILLISFIIYIIANLSVFKTSNEIKDKENINTTDTGIFEEMSSQQNYTNNFTNNSENNLGIEEKDNNKVEPSIENVKFSVKENTLTNTGATFIIIDTNEIPYTYSEWYCIQKKNENKWETMQPVIKENYDALMVGDNGKVEFKINWGDLYGELQNGEYRMVKRVSENENEFLYAYFSL